MDRGMGRNEKKLHDEGEGRTDIPGGSKERNDQMKLKKEETCEWLERQHGRNETRCGLSFVEAKQRRIWAEWQNQSISSMGKLC